MFNKLLLGDIITICYGKNQKEVEKPRGLYNIYGTGGKIGETNDYLYDKPSVLIGRKGTINKPMYVDKPFWTVDTLFYSKIKSNFDPLWLYYYIDSIDLNKYNEATGVPSLSISNLYRIEILTPSLEEQKKIAKILSTVDGHIDEVDGMIDTLKELKKGLMQKLLTQGVGHTEFKDSEVGRIPVEWEVKQIDDVISFMKSGLSRKLSDHDIGIPCIRSSNIDDGKISSKDLKYWYLLDDKGADINNYKLEDGDVLVNFINSLAQIGKTCIYKDIGRDVIYTTNLFRLKIDHEIMNVHYFHFITQTEYYRNEVALITKPAVNQASFTSGDFKKIEIAVPPLEEQRKIADKLCAIDDRIELYKDEYSSLQILKKGLMQQLLTGKTRVKIDN